MMPEHSVLWSPDELCWAHVILLSTMHTNYADTSVFHTPSLSSTLSFQDTTNSQNPALTRHAPGEQTAAVDEFFSLGYAASLASVLRRYFTSQHIMSLANVITTYWVYTTYTALYIRRTNHAIVVAYLMTCATPLHYKRTRIEQI